MSAHLTTRAAALLVLLLPTVASAQDLAITGGTVLTGTGQKFEHGTVLIHDGKVTAVGSGLTVPAGVRVLDATGKTVTPGLINSYTSVGAVEIEAVNETNDIASNNPRFTAAFSVVYGLDPYSTLLPIERDGGVTSAVVAPAARASIIGGQGALIHLAGAVADSMIIRAPLAMFGILNEGAAERSGGSRGDAMLRLREFLEDVRDYARNPSAFEARNLRDLSLSRLDLEAMVPVVQGRLPLVLSVDRAPDILNALALAREFKLHLVLAGAAEGWLVADAIARDSVGVIIDPLTDIPGYDQLAATLSNAARLQKAGVTVALATFDAHNARNVRFLAGNAVANGMPYDAALAAITSAPARIWRVEQQVGALAPGRQADLVVWSGDPLELMTQAEHVFIGGREMPQDNRQRELLARYRHLSDSLPPAYRR